MKNKIVIWRFLRGALVLTLAGTMQSVVFAQASPDQENLKQVPAEKQKEAEKPALSIGTEAVYNFVEEVTPESVKKFIDAVEQLHGINALHAPKEMMPIRINLNSPGGDAIGGFAFMEEVSRMRSLGHHVTIAAYGMAASAASYMLQAADTRIIGPHSWILLHEVKSSPPAMTTYSQLQVDLALTGALWQEYKDIIIKRSKLTDEVLEKHCHGFDWWIPAKEALKLGLVDKIDVEPPFSKNAS